MAVVSISRRQTERSGDDWSVEAGIHTAAALVSGSQVWRKIGRRCAGGLVTGVKLSATPCHTHTHTHIATQTDRKRDQ